MKAGGELSNLLNKEFKILFRDFQKFPLRCCAIMRERESSFHLFFRGGTIVNTISRTGGHLALTTGMLKESDGLDTNCAGDRGEAEPRVAAIVNWYGVTD